jgi:invasion protein IalB
MYYTMSRVFITMVLAGLVAASATAEEVDLQALSYTPWTKTCLEGTCFVWSDGHSNPDCGSVVSAVLIRRPGEAKNALHVTLPPRVNTERGVRIIIDQSKPIERPYGWLEVKCHRCSTSASIPLDAVRRPRDTPIWKLEAALKCRSCKKGRYAPPVHMIKLTKEREITPYLWTHPEDDDRR